MLQWFRGVGVKGLFRVFHQQNWSVHFFAKSLGLKTTIIHQHHLLGRPHIVSPGIEPGYIRLPQSKIIMYIFHWNTAIVWKNWKFLAVRRVWAWWPFASVMSTVRFPITWLGNVWEPAPRFLGLALRHLNAVTWTCDWQAWFSAIYTFININTIPFCNSKFWSLQQASFLFQPWCFLWWAAFCPSSASV